MFAYYNEELYHHGIKGMRWGVRRYQNPDGTLTEGGKARYNSDGSKKRAHEMSDEDLRKSSNRLRSEQEYNRLTGNSTRDKIFNKDMAVKLGIGVTGALGTALLMNNLNPSKIKKGKELVDNLLLVAGTTSIATITSSIGANMVGDKKKK